MQLVSLYSAAIRQHTSPSHATPPPIKAFYEISKLCYYSIELELQSLVVSNILDTTCMLYNLSPCYQSLYG